MKIHHIGIATKNIEESLKKYEFFFNIKRKSEIVFDQEQNSYLIFLETNEGLNVEFISGEKVANIVEKGIYYYHLCYEVDDIELTIERFNKKGAIIISPPKPAKLFNNRKVAFVYASDGIVEFLEKEIK